MKRNKFRLYLFLILSLILVIAIFLAIYFYKKGKVESKNDNSNPFVASADIQPNTSTKSETTTKVNTEFTAPIYMYHHIQDTNDSMDQTSINLSLSSTLFTEEMNYLKTNGYKTLTLNQMLDTPLDKAVILTFDDGYIDILDNAYPVMQKLGFVGTVFAITDLVGTPGYMTWSDLKNLQSAGWDIESHTVSHPDLANLDTTNAEYQIAESKKIIEQELNTKVNFLCYPAGKYTDETISLLKQAGYKGAVTTQYGLDNSTNNIFELQRIRINGGTSLDSFISPL